MATMKASLEDDIERVSSILSQESEAMIRITLNTTEGDTVPIMVGRNERIHEAVFRCLKCGPVDEIDVRLGNDAVGGNGESFEEEDIEDGARLGVAIIYCKDDFHDVASDTYHLNKGPEYDYYELLDELERAAAGYIDHEDESVINCDLNWANNNLRSLPDNFGDLTIHGDLRLHGNHLESLPESFVRLTVDGTVDLRGNPLSQVSKKQRDQLSEKFHVLTSIPW